MANRVEPKIERLHDDRLDEQLFHTVLPSGLHIYVLPKAGFTKKYATFATHYGSIDSRFRVPTRGQVVAVPDGIAHFLEHQMFAQEYGDAFEKFSELGASANAFTTFSSTTYLFSATDRFEESLEVLLDFVQTPHFTERGVKKEQGIIEQEIRMYQDHPGWRLGQSLREALYQVHPVRIDIAGTVDSIRQIDKGLLDLCYETFYHPSNMVVSVVGGVDPDAVIRQVAENVARHGRLQPQAPIERFVPTEPADVNQRATTLHMSVARPLFALGFKERQPAPYGRDLLLRDMTTGIALEAVLGKSSPLYNRLYEEGIIDKGFHASYMGESTFGLTTIGGETDQPERLREALLAGIEEARSQGVAPEAFERERRRMLADYIRQFDSPEALTYILNSSHFEGVGIFEYLSVWDAVTLDEVNRRLREHLDPEFSAHVLVLPKEG